MEEIYVEEQEIVDFIFDRLLKRGIAVRQEDISLILNLELDFLESKGIVSRED